MNMKEERFSLNAWEGELWSTFVADVETKAYSLGIDLVTAKIDVDYFGYDNDSMGLILVGQRPETEKEKRVREARETKSEILKQQMAAKKTAKERKEYERLRKKFEN